MLSEESNKLSVVADYVHVVLATLPLAFFQVGFLKGLQVHLFNLESRLPKFVIECDAPRGRSFGNFIVSA